MVSSGAKMSYERRLWSRQEVSFPYIVVCWSTSRILILLEGMRGCQPVQKAWPWASGSVGKQEPLQKKDHSAPWLLKQHQLSELESCYDERRGRGGMCFILPSLTQETIPPSQIYFTLPHPSSFYSLGFPPTSSHPRTFFPYLFPSALWFCSYSSYPPLMLLSRSQQGLTWLWDHPNPTHVPLVTISGKSPCYKTLWTGLLYGSYHLWRNKETRNKVPNWIQQGRTGTSQEVEGEGGNGGWGVRIDRNRNRATGYNVGKYSSL